MSKVAKQQSNSSTSLLGNHTPLTYSYLTDPSLYSQKHNNPSDKETKSLMIKRQINTKANVFFVMSGNILGATI